VSPLIQTHLYHKSAIKFLNFTNQSWVSFVNLRMPKTKKKNINKGISSKLNKSYKRLITTRSKQRESFKDELKRNLGEIQGTKTKNSNQLNLLKSSELTSKELRALEGCKGKGHSNIKKKFCFRKQSSNRVF
jgi:hypothetical protein